MEPVEFEVCLEVADYLEGDDATTAFELASEDTSEATAAGLAQLTEWIGDDAHRLGMSVEFVEFDASNAHHAGAMWKVTVTGDESLLAVIRAKLEEEMNGD